MSDEKDLGEELLRQNGIELDSLPEGPRRELRDALEGERKRLIRMKRATVAAWSLAALVCVLGVVTEVAHESLRPGNAELWWGEGRWVLPVALFACLAILGHLSMYFASRSVTQREIQASLADIAEQLKQLAKDQQAKAED